MMPSLKFYIIFLIKVKAWTWT